MLLYSPSKCSFTLSKLIQNAWLFLLAARHRMQALSALACCVGCAFSGFVSLKIALFIQLLTNVGDPLILMGHPHPYSFLFSSSCSLNISSRYCAASMNSILSAASCIRRRVRSMLFFSCSALMYSTIGSHAMACCVSSL